MSGGGVSYKLSEFAKSLPEVEFKFYCEKIEELKCNDPLVIDLHFILNTFLHLHKVMSIIIS